MKWCAGWTALVAGLVMVAGPAGVEGRDKAAVQLVTVDPGHFHAALVQKFMLPGVSPLVRVFAPAGEDLEQHVKRIEGFNSRADQPTNWKLEVYSEADWLDRAMSACAAGRIGTATPCVVVLSGNNARKTEYITRAIEAGMHVLADKPMAITPADFVRLEAAFALARSKRVLLYDIMTERFEITTVLQRELSRQKALFGVLQRGTPAEPAITKISVHNFSKMVAGTQLRRPPWFFDPAQQGAGIVDVTTHLVDLVQWESFPGVTLQPSNVRVLAARRWATPITQEQFTRVTGQATFPDYLQPHLKDAVLMVPANGELTYTLKGVHAKVSVTWDFEAPAGAGDTHFSVMRGTKASLTIRQGQEQGFKPVLYVQRAEAESVENFQRVLQAAITQVARRYPGIGLRQQGDEMVVTVPERYHIGHEAHFTQVTRNFLKYLEAGELPGWEVPNMLTKYATLMQAYELTK